MRGPGKVGLALLLRRQCRACNTLRSDPTRMPSTRTSHGTCSPLANGQLLAICTRARSQSGRPHLGSQCVPQLPGACLVHHQREPSPWHQPAAHSHHHRPARGECVTSGAWRRPAWHGRVTNAPKHAGANSREGSASGPQCTKSAFEALQLRAAPFSSPAALEEHARRTKR